MSVQIELFDFSKRERSTKVPAGAGTIVDANIKSDCSFYNPTFEIAMLPNINFNYCKYNGMFFYLVDKVVTANNLVEISFTIDKYATYKANILATTAYVLYDSHSNVDIPDDRVPTNKNITITTSTTTFPIALTPNNGRFVMTVVNNDGVQWFILSESLMSTFLADLATWTDDLLNGFTPDWSSVQSSLHTICDFFSTLFKQGTSSGNVMENVKSVVWMPIAPNGGSFPIKIGNYTSNYTTAKWTFTQPSTGNVSVSIPWQFSDWRNKSQYTSVYLYIPYVGVQAFDANNLIGISSLDIEYSLDGLTGDITFLVKASGNILGVYKSNIAVQVPIGAMTQGSLGGITTGLVAGATAAAKYSGGNPYAMAAGALAGEFLGKAKTTNASIIGSLTGLSTLGVDDMITCIVESNNTLYNPHDISAIKGEPRHANMLLSNCSGYVQTSGAQVDVATTDEIRKALNAGLDSGIFIE